MREIEIIVNNKAGKGKMRSDHREPKVIGNLDFSLQEMRRPTSVASCSADQ